MCHNHISVMSAGAFCFGGTISLVARLVYLRATVLSYVVNIFQCDSDIILLFIIFIKNQPHDQIHYIN